MSERRPPPTPGAHGAPVQRALQHALHLLRAGRSQAAKEACEALLKSFPATPEAHEILATVAHSARDLDGAVGHLRAALALDPGSATLHVNLAALLSERRQTTEAIALLHRAIERKPDLVVAHNNLAALLNSTGRYAEALAAAEQCLALRPGLPQALFALGNAQIALGRIDAGIATLRSVVAHMPGNAQAFYNLGAALAKQHRYDEAIPLFERATEIRPEYVAAMIGLARALKKVGRRDASLAHLDRVIALRPHALSGYFSRCMAELPIVYGDGAEVDILRASYSARLGDLASRAFGCPEEALAEAADAVGATTPFFLAYQGKNDHDLQRTYGDVVCRIMAARYPRWSAPLPRASLAPNEPLRVGIVSGFFSRDHSVWKTHIRGWVQRIDPKRFQLFGYQTRSTAEEVERELVAGIHRFDAGPRSVDEWAERIRGDRLHALVYPEIGMDVTSTRLAALRLASVQCTSWGHPVTSGFPTLDYFLSSDAMEPPDGQEHYTETLVRLPNLGIFYEPLAPPSLGRTRSHWGLPDGGVLYWCCQSLYKYIPDFDDVFPAIAAGVPSGKFVFIEGDTAGLTALFRARLERAFARRGLRAADRCIFLPRLSPEEFGAAIGCVDVFLDSIGWSGCNSTLECVARDLPIVTMPGETMRSRHSTAILRIMGMSECVSTSVDDYVNRAIALGIDPAERGRVARQIAATKHVLFRDRLSISALEAFLVHACGAAE